jgi:hypothetical protein
MTPKLYAVVTKVIHILLFLDLVVGGQDSTSTNLVYNVQYTFPGLNCTTNVQPKFPYGETDPSLCVFTTPDGVTCIYDGVNAGPTATGVQMFRLCTNNWNWVAVGSVSTDDQTRAPYVCDTARGLISYRNDGSVSAFNVNTLTWDRRSLTRPYSPSPYSAAITQGADPAGCLGGDGKYYNFGGATSIYIQQWDPIAQTVNCFGTMPDPGANINIGSKGMCCVAVPGQPNLIFVTLNSALYSYDYAIFDISANPTASACNKGAWFNKTICRNLPNYKADLTLRDCSICGGNIVLGPGGNPYNSMFTLVDLSGATPACQYITGGDVVNTTSRSSIVRVPPNVVPGISSQCQVPV